MLNRLRVTGSANIAEPIASVSHSGKVSLVAIARSTLQKIEEGSYELNGIAYTLKDAVEVTDENTLLYPDDLDLSEWASKAPSSEVTDSSSGVQVAVSEASTLSGAQSIARSSTMYPSLTTETVQPFYQSHKKNPKNGYYSHAMIYSPRVLLLRSHDGEWMAPVEVDIVTSPAVNAGTVRNHLHKIDSEDESEVDATMKERMARILYLFERHGVRNLVLGSFGTGAFRNRVELVAGIWKELLVSEDARFKCSFVRIVFAILGEATFKVFETTFSGNEGIKFKMGSGEL
ncbi:hypothetical protein BDZ97DRAFT_1906054 [Flammula alnicola]|nr:hypothetical protein BDZ97DRAFT_1906054 [Flammula alnicola]